MRHLNTTELLVSEIFYFNMMSVSYEWNNMIKKFNFKKK